MFSYYIPAKGITSAWIKSLHLEIFNALSIGECWNFFVQHLAVPLVPGEYRVLSVHINYNEKTTPQLHRHLMVDMPDWRNVPVLIDKLCADLTSRWNTTDPFRIAAEFVLGVGSIHPFLGFNGRTCRLGAHLILCSKLGLDVRLGPGTLPEIIIDAHHCDEWFRACGKHARGVGDVSAMESLLRDCFQEEHGGVEVKVAAGR
jgi:hypothetical protein